MVIVRIIRAETLGMCFGVRDAISAAMRTPAPETVTILGELVHNRQVNAELRRRGFRLRSEKDRDRVPDTPRVLITAHGVSDRERNRLADAGKDIIDTTCPLVRRIHDTALRLERSGYFVVIIGKRSHVEVQGIAGDLRCHAVVQHLKDVVPFPADRLGVVCQSTTSPRVAQRILAAIYAANPGKRIHFVPTFCAPTRKRQAAVQALLQEVDAVVVVGGRNSNNTRELVRLVRSRRVPCLHVCTAADIDPDWFEPYDTVGLTAGTSTADETIEAVHRSLRAIAFRKEIRGNGTRQEETGLPGWCCPAGGRARRHRSSGGVPERPARPPAVRHRHRRRHGPADRGSDGL